jgi:hypothetical protein
MGAIVSRFSRNVDCTPFFAQGGLLPKLPEKFSGKILLINQRKLFTEFCQLIV